MPGLNERLRPTTFDEVVGNHATVEKLRAWLQTEDKWPTLFFEGPIGTGKTTLARIVARQLGTEEPFSFWEYDLTHHKKEILEDMLRKLSLGFSSGALGYTVCFFDEIHYLPIPLQAKLLKKAESPPEEVIFIFAAPDSKDLLPALVDRCRKFKVAPLTRKEMRILLDRACKKEGVRMDEAEIKRIVKEAAGYPRNALSLLDESIDLIRARTDAPDSTP